MLSVFSPKTYIGVILSVAISRIKMISRYRGWFLMDLILPTLFAAIPIFLGRAFGGANAAQNFQMNTGTTNYVAYMVIGANIFMIVSGALWVFGFWLRREQQTGTLESIYLAPTNKMLILAGIALYAAVRSMIMFFVAFSGGCLIFGVNPFSGNIVVAALFLAFGLVPVYGISFLYGALVLKLKEANSLIQLAQWVVGFLMGIYFPITIFPRYLQWVAMAFPPTWMNNGIRASLLGIGYFFDKWYYDLAVLWAFCVIAPMLGYYVFLATERGIKKKEGVGQF